MNVKTMGAITVTGWIEAAVAKYGSIALGVAVGIAAKYGLALGEGRKVTVRMVVIDALLVGMIVLLAANAADRLGTEGNTAALIAAVVAVSSDRLIRLIRQAFLRRAEAKLLADLDRVKGEMRQAVQVEISGQEVLSDLASGKRDLPS